MSTPPSRHPAGIDLAHVNDAHVLAIGRVPANSRVLHLGCADGSVAETLRRMGCRVWGVEPDPVDADRARAWCEEVVEADLAQVDLRTTFGDQRFDVVLMLDVLEHMADPAAVLGKVTAVLDSNGWGVLSLANIAHVSRRLALLQGRFRYTDTGLLDRTHPRFFDRAGVEDLLVDAGWTSFDLERVTRSPGETEFQVDGADPDLVTHLLSDPEGITYQFVVAAAPAGWSALVEPPFLPAARAQRALLAAQADVRRLQQMVVPDLADRLEVIRQRSTERRGHLGSLLEALEENTERLRQTLTD